MESDFWSCDRYDSEAQRLYDEGDYESALRLLEEGIALYPNSAELRVSLGYSHLAREEFGWARRSFEEALVLAPDHEEGLAGLGDALLKLGERGRAFLAFERVLALGFDDDPELMVCIARSLAREGLDEKAERFLRLALTTDPRCADAAMELAAAYWRRGDAQAALTSCRRALLAHPEHHEARALCGNLLYERGEFAAALEEFQRIPASNFWDPVAAWRAVELLRRLQGMDADAPELAPYLERLEVLSPEPSPEEQVLAEVEALQDGTTPRRWRPRTGQLDLFAWVPRGEGAEEAHRVRAPDGRIFEGGWETIVRAMRDHSANPSASVSEFMRDEARRLHNLTGQWIAFEDPRTFIAESARVGALYIER